MVLLVHGGPWARDFWGFNSAAQWFANRGYAVLQVTEDRAAEQVLVSMERDSIRRCWLEVSQMRPEVPDGLDPGSRSESDLFLQVNR